MQNLIAVFSLLIGLAGLTLSYMGHRQKVRQETQETALFVEQLQGLQRERGQDQEQRKLQERVQRERERRQASMIKTRLELRPSSLHDGWVVPEIVVENRSDQLLRDVRVAFLHEVIGEATTLDTGQHAFQLPPAQAAKPSHKLRFVTVDFTDIAGIRWRRDGDAGLRRAQPGTDSPDSRGAWGDPEDLYVTAARDVIMGAPASPPPPPPSGASQTEPVGRHLRFLQPAIVLVSVTLIAGALWWLLSR